METLILVLIGIALFGLGGATMMLLSLFIGGTSFEEDYNFEDEVS